MTYPQNTGTSVMLLYLHVTIKTQPMNIILQLKKGDTCIHSGD